jgi:cytoskeleton protein RodZ
MNAAGSSESAASETAAPGSAELLTPGELLRRERERRSLTLLHAAEELHLDTKVVEAIEANQFEKLGVPVYARGHLRNYAALMGLSPEFIIQRYEALTGRPEAPPPIPASVAVGTSVSLQRRSLAGPLWLAVGLVALILGWWLWTTVSTPGDPMQSVLSDADVTDGPGSIDNGSTDNGSPPVDVTATPAPGAMQPVAAAGSSSPPASEVRLRLEYRDSSWTEIYDAAGRRLMFALGESGRARTVSGTPPLRITLGNASAVTVQVNDRSVVVPRQQGRDSAKFVVAAGGAVQMSDEVSVE